MKKYAIIKVFILMHCIAIFTTNPAFCGSKKEKEEVLRQRLYEEVTSIALNKKLQNIQIARKDFKWYAVFTGPENTPYAGGTFIIVIRFPIGYPIEMPQVRFITKIYHPNVKSRTGEICLDILQNWSQSPKNIQSVLLSILPLFKNPQLIGCSGFVPAVESEYKQHYDEFISTAIFWTNTFAHEESKLHKIQKKIRIINP